MGPRTILYTGKGGAGTTSVAAVTARRIAAAGGRTLLLGAGPAHALADALGAAVGGEPGPVDGALWAQALGSGAAAGVDAPAEDGWRPADPAAEALLAIAGHGDSGRFDAIVVDCGPAAAALRMLALPDAARAWLERAHPQLGVTPDAPAGAATAARDVMVAGELLRDADRTSVRPVTTAERIAVDDTRRTLTALSLYGVLADAVVANRLLPADAGASLADRREAEQAHVRDLRDALAPVPVLRGPQLPEEARGPAALDRLGDALFAGADPAGVLHEAVGERLTVGPGEASLRLELPFAEKGDVAVRKVGLDLVVRVDDHRRTLRLPPALGGYRPRGAALRDGALTVSFDGPAR